jgi:hypothetical protein
MNTNKELDQIVRTWLDDRAVDPPHASLASAMAQVATTPQQRRRWLGRWLGRGRGATRSADDRGDTNDTNNGRNRLMFGITGVTAGAAALALMAALVVPRGDPGQPVTPGAGGGATHVVAADGSGDFTTIGEAVAAAAEGDTVLVKPGQYAEVVLVDKDITLQGDGPRKEVVISFPEGGPNDPDWGFPITLVVRDSQATITALTILTPSKGGAVLVNGGSPTFEDVSVENVPDGMGTFNLGEGTSAIVRDSSWDGFWMIDDSPVILEGNTIAGFGRLFGPDAATISGNAFLAGADVHVHGLAGLIEGNEFSDATITVESGSDGDGESAVTVRGNTFHDVKWNGSHGQAAILVQDSGSTTDIVNNVITGSDTAVSVAFGSAATISGNDLRDNRAALVVGSSDVDIDGNTIMGNGTGLRLGKTIEKDDAGLHAGDAARPTVNGNTFCDNEIDLELPKDEPNSITLDGNEVCAAAAAG